jgi:hypothetical protein
MSDAGAGAGCGPKDGCSTRITWRADDVGEVQTWSVSRPGAEQYAQFRTRVELGLGGGSDGGDDHCAAKR